MATQKRRVIYLSDEDWTTLRQDAHDARLSISAYVRTLLIARFAVVDRPSGMAIQLGQGPTFNSRPFTPVPKRQ